MRVLAFSDWRVQPIEDIYSTASKYSDLDLIVYAGDDLGRFVDGETNHFAELANYTSERTVLVVAGNDDIGPFIAEATDPDPVHNLHLAPLKPRTSYFWASRGVSSRTLALRPIRKTRFASIYTATTTA